MPKRLETSKDVLDGLFYKSAGALEDISKQIREIENRRNDVAERLKFEKDPSAQQQGQNFLNSYGQQISDLKRQQQDLLSSGQEQLNYDQLRNQDLPFKSDPSYDKKNIPFNYPSPPEREEGDEGPIQTAEGPNQETTFDPFGFAQKLKHILPVGDRLAPSDLEIDFKSVKKLLYPNKSYEQLTDLEKNEIESEVERRRQEVADYAQKRLVRDIEKKQQDKQQDQSEKKNQKDFQNRIITDNKIWEALTPGNNLDAGAGKKGTLDDIEKQVINSMLPTAAEDIPVEENQKGDPRWNEFMGDLFEIVQKNRDNVTFGKGPKAKYLDTSIDDPRTSSALFSSFLEKRSVSSEERQRGLTGKEGISISLPKFRNREPTPEEILTHLKSIIAKHPEIQERNKAAAGLLEVKIQELKKEYEDPSRMIEFQQFAYELNEVRRQIEETDRTLVWAEKSLKEMESTGRTPTIPSKGNKKNEESPQAPETFYRAEITEGLTFGIRSLADKYPELNIQEGMRSIIQEGPPPRMDRPDYSAPLSGYGQSFIRGEKEGENVSLSGELDLEDYSGEELDDLLSEMEKDQTYSRPYRIDARGFVDAFGVVASDLPSRAKDFDEIKEMLFPNIPEEKLTPEQFKLIDNEVKKRLPEVDDDYANLQNNAEAINEALESDHRIRIDEVQDQVSLIGELAEEGGGEYLKQKYGSLILKEDSQGLVSLKDLRGFPGGDYIESWIRRKYDLDQDDPVRYDQLPNNSEAEVILGNAAKSMEAEWFQDSGKGKEIKRLVEPEVRKRTRARDFINSKYSQKPLGVGSNPKDRREEKLNRANYETHGEKDPAFLSDRADWIYGTVAQLRDDESLTENQKEAAETWFSYDYWFQNVYDNKHEEENIFERIGNLLDPEFLAAEQARFASRTIGEVLGQKRAESPDDIYDWQKELNKMPERMQDEQLDEKEAKNEMKAMTEDFLLKKVAEFMVYDGPTISFLASRDPYNRNAEGQYSRRPQNNGGGTSDVADVIFEFISASITARRTNGLGRFNAILDQLKLKNIQNAKMGEKKTPEEVLSPEEDNSLVDEPEENSKKVINMDDLRSEAVRIYIRQLSKPAISEEFRKGSRRLKSIQMVSLDPSNRPNTSLSKSFNDLMAGADEVDTANRIQSFDEQMSETIAQVTDREAGDQDSSYLDIVDAVTMRSFMLKFKNGLNDQQKQEFDFFYGNGQRDIYKEGQNDASEFVTLDTEAAEKYWKLTFNKSISADRIAQKKRNLDRLLKYAIYRTANESPDFLKILNETIVLQKEDVEEALANQNVTDQMVEDNNTTISDESDLANIDRLRRQNKE